MKPVGGSSRKLDVVARSWIPALALVACLGSLPASAADGVAEINQACAVNSGCFPGDAPGFPVQITASGSYALTGNLTVTSAVDAILVTADRVSLDLRGFALQCNGGSCPDGVDATARSDLRVHGGIIAGFSQNGVIAGSDATFVDLIASFNRLVGLERTQVARCSVRSASPSLDVGANSIVWDSSFLQSLGNGVAAEDSVVIVHNRIEGSTGHGVLAFEASVLAGNEVSESGAIGFVLRDGSLLLENAVGGSTGLAATINLPGHQYGYAGNVFTSNGTAEIQLSGGVELGENLCGSDDVCP